MFHIILTSETLLTNQRPLRYTAAAVSVTAADFAINAAAAVYVASATFTIIATIFTVFTATATISVSSASASDRSPHSVSSVRPWSYHPLAPFPQSVTSI
jgi:hypothetical protein